MNKPILSLFAASLIALTPMNTLAQTPPQTQPQTPPQTQTQPPTTTPTTPPEPREVVREQPVSVRDRERPEYDAPGRRLGGFELNAALDLSATSTDNLFASPDGFEEDDIYYEVTPSARLESDWSRHALGFRGSYTARMHDEFDNEDTETYSVSGNGRLDIGANSNVSGGARFAHLVNPRTDPDDPQVGDPVEYDLIDTTVGAQHRFARVLVRGDAVYRDYDYEGVQDFRDNEQTVLRGRVEVDLWPRVGLVLQAVADDYQYVNSPNLDSEGRAYLVGARIDGDLLNGEVSVGQFERDYADPSIGTFDGLAVAAALEWYITRLTTITLSGRQDADDQISVSVGEPYIVTEFGMRVDHELLRNLILTAAVLGGEREYESIDRHDEYAEFVLGADYLLNPHAAVRFRYDYHESDSSGAVPGRDFEENALTLGLSLRL